MLKSTENTLNRDQFVKLREVRQHVKDQFNEDFSLQSEDVFSEAYKFALQSETNELFRLFSDLNEISDHPVERPLNEEQFVLLREAKKLILAEQNKNLQLDVAEVMDELYGFAKGSASEELLDIYMYLVSRKECPPLTTGGLERSTEPDSSDLAFEEVSAPDFERLRDAKLSIVEEFDETLSLHSSTTLDDLYGFAVRSSEIELFELFSDLLAPQALSREESWQSQSWLSREQFELLREARTRVQGEFGVVIDLRSEGILSELYQHALRAEKEELFDLCWEFQRTNADKESAKLPSKDEFRMLREARTLVATEFDQELQLQSDAVEYDFYKFAVSSSSDELFDLYTELMVLPARITPRSEIEGRAQLSREEFILLRDARGLIREEFDQHLALEKSDVLDRLYGFALDSESEALFDLHAELNTGATESTPDSGGVANRDEPKSETTQDVKAQNETEVVGEASEPNERNESTDSDSSQSEAERVEPQAVAKQGGILARLFGKSEQVSARDRVAAAETPAVEELPLEETASSTREESKAEDDATDGVEAAAEIETESEKEKEQEKEQEQEQEQEQEAEAPAELASEESEEDLVTADALEPDAVDQATSAEQEETEEPAAPSKKDFGDMLVQAMQKERDGANKKPASSKKKAAPKAVQSETKSKKPLRTDIKASDSNWYISAETNQMQIRLTGPLAVDVDGELAFSTKDDEALGAWFDLVDGDPVVAVETAEVRVNDEVIEGLHILAAGDQVKVAGQSLQVVSITDTKAIETAASS